MSVPTDSGIPLEWGLIAAPKALLPVLYRQVEEFLGLSPTGRPAADTSSSASVENEPATDGWTDELLSKFAATGRRLNSIRIVVAVMDICAGRPDEWVPTSELLKHLSPQGIEASQLKIAWTHLSRHLNAQYGHSEWPLDAQWGPDFGHPTSEVYYRLSSARAQQWNRIRTHAK
jgi:hypothetical protein